MQPLCLGFKASFPTSLTPFTLFFCEPRPPAFQTKLTGPGDFVNALPVSWSVVLPMQVLFLLPILRLKNLFQEAVPDGPCPALILHFLGT